MLKLLVQLHMGNPSLRQTQMANLRKFTLSHQKKKDRWELKNDKTDRVVRTFGTKSEAMAGGILAGVLGKEGGSVKIRKIDGKYQEERTFPRSKDPKKSPG